MARQNNWRDISPTLNAATNWINNCLVQNGSVFTPNKEIWLPENIEELKVAFIENPDESTDDFITKLKRQTLGCSKNTKQLAAEMLWVLYLFPAPCSMGPNTKREQIKRMLDGFSDVVINFAVMSDDVLTGIGACGTAYSTERWRELAYLIILAANIKQQKNRSEIFGDYDLFLKWISEAPQEGKRQFRQMLRYYVFPDIVERMASNNDREKILKKVLHKSNAEINIMNDKELDMSLMEIRQQYEAKYPNQILDFYEPPLVGMWRDNQTSPPPPPKPPTDLSVFTIEQMRTEGVFLNEPEIERIKHRLETKKNLILQGAPGVGKTFVAKKLAYLLMGEKADDRIVSVQFHPSYSYEDFVRGYRPTDEAGKFQLVDGIFWKLCDKARQNLDRKYVILIDEINRGNLSQIFGELFMLLEADKRNEQVSPLYSKLDSELFSIPDNVHLIGTMNIADRSLALVDYALRRRFAFVTLEPQFTSGLFSGWLEKQGASGAINQQIKERMTALNNRISNDSQLGEAFRIGHSFFCQKPAQGYSDDWFKEIIETEIIPLLEEYWHDNRSQLNDAIAELRQ